MGMQDTVRDAYGIIKALMGDASVAVVINGVSGTGLINSKPTAGSLLDFGEAGKPSSTVWVSGADFTAPAIGSTVIVDSHDVMVSNVTDDPVGGLIRIDYTETKPVEGV